MPSALYVPAFGGLALGKLFCFLDLSSQSAASGNGLDGVCICLLEGGLLLVTDADIFSWDRRSRGKACLVSLVLTAEPERGSTQVFTRRRSPREVT